MLRPGLVLCAVVAGLSATGAFDASQIGDRPDAAAWQGYLQRSEARAAADRDALQAEVESTGKPLATKAPSGGDFRPPDADERQRFAGDEAGRLADALLSFQAPSGGWSKHIGYGKGPRQPGMQWTSQSDPGSPPHYQATFDNGATVREIEFLASVAEATGRQDCRDAVVRGFGYILDAQYPSGGWPQVYPLEGGYHDNVTFNDNAMTNVMALLLEAGAGEGRFAFLDADLRRRLDAALARGIDFVLASQVTIDGRKTVWCAQHDPLTLEPVAARAFEPASLSGVESAHLVKFLMGLPNPSAGCVAGIEAALGWLEGAQVKGIAKVKRDGRTVYVPDPASTDVYWARFYDLATGKPMFPGRDGVTYGSYEELAAASDKIGYDYYSTQPGSIIRNGQKKWRKRLGDTR